MGHSRRSPWRAAGRRLSERLSARPSRPPERPGAREERAAAAALLLGALTLWLGLPAAPADPTDCPQPRELAARDGWTSAVSCTETMGESAPLRGPVRLLFGQPLDLNRSDASALEALPGIGPGRAAAIALARRAGPFRSLRDLQRVPGIGPRIAFGLREWVEVSGASGAPAEP